MIKKSLSYPEFKLETRDELYLRSIAIPKLVNSSHCSVPQAWFETFIEHLERIGYKIVPIEEEL